MISKPRTLIAMNLNGVAVFHSPHFVHLHDNITMYTSILSIIFQVLVIIDAKPKDLGLPTEAYIAVEEVHDVRPQYIQICVASLCTANVLQSEFFG